MPSPYSRGSGHDDARRRRAGAADSDRVWTAALDCNTWDEDGRRVVVEPVYDRDGMVLYHGEALAIMPTLPAGSIDAIITDPPYPEIDRPYGRWTEAEWHELMRGVVAECRRVLKPSGSAVFVLQPNSERVGRMRPWLWEFMAWTAREWNQVQDVWWWNPSAQPTIHCRRQRGLMRPSIKGCVWLGDPDCYRNQDEILWSESEANKAVDRSDRALRYHHSGAHFRQGRCSAVADERGGVTPFNLIPIANTNSVDSGGANGHGAATPFDLADWWTRYICPPGGTILDPFAGSCTVGLAAARRRRKFIGIERYTPYISMAIGRLSGPPMPLFDDPAGPAVRADETPLFDLGAAP